MSDNAWANPSNRAPAGPSRSARNRRPPGSKYADSMTSSFVGAFRTEKDVTIMRSGVVYNTFRSLGGMGHLAMARRSTLRNNMLGVQHLTRCTALNVGFYDRGVDAKATAVRHPRTLRDLNHLSMQLLDDRRAEGPRDLQDRLGVGDFAGIDVRE